MKNIFLSTLILLFIFGCSGKDMKQYGGELALGGGSGGNPVMAGVGLVVGGTLYGVGSLVDNEEDTKKEE